MCKDTILMQQMYPQSVAVRKDAPEIQKRHGVLNNTKTLVICNGWVVVAGAGMKVKVLGKCSAMPNLCSNSNIVEY